MSRRLDAAGGAVNFQSTIASTARCRVELQLIFLTESESIETEVIKLVLDPSDRHERATYFDGLVDDVIAQFDQVGTPSGVLPIRDFLVTRRSILPMLMKIEDSFQAGGTLEVTVEGNSLKLNVSDSPFARITVSPMQMVIPVGPAERLAILTSGLVDGFAQSNDKPYETASAAWGDGLIRRSGTTLTAASFVLKNRNLVGIHTEVFGHSQLQCVLTKQGKETPQKCVPVNELDDLLRRVINNYLALATGPLKMKLPLVVQVNVCGTHGLYVLKQGDNFIGGPGPIPQHLSNISVSLPILRMSDWNESDKMLFTVREAIYDAGRASGRPFGRMIVLNN
jgi:hypothetical protein